MLQVDIRPPDALSAQEIAAWRAFQASHPAFGSPLLSPAFARIMGEVREDTRVAVFRQDGAVAGVFVHHRRPSPFGQALARPVGGPWSDEQAVLTGGPGLDVRSAFAAAGIRAARLPGVIDPHGLFDGQKTAGETAYAIRLDGSAEDYLESLRAGSPKRFKNLRRLGSKLEREKGEVTLVAPDRDPEALETLLRWKREQFHRTGVHDVLGPDWCRGLMERAFASTDPEAEGLMITLRVDGRIAAGQFGLRSPGLYHPWIAAYDPELAAYSPGIALIWRAILAMPGLGLTGYELSGGFGYYKGAFANVATPIQEAKVELGGGGRRLPLPTVLVRAGRRFDRILETEVTLAGRVAGMAEALQAIPRRLSYTPPRSEDA